MMAATRPCRAPLLILWLVGAGLGVGSSGVRAQGTAAGAGGDGGRSQRASLGAADGGVQAQDAATTRFNFAEAAARLADVSDALAAARAGVSSARDLSSATKHLRWPDIAADVRELHYQKTLDLPLTALPAEFNLPEVLHSVQTEWRLRPFINASLPLYTGGRISAAQDRAAAAVRQASAELDLVTQSTHVQLVRAYFGQQLAERVLAIRRDVRDGLQQHLAHTEALEAQGFATTAQRLQAIVARDQAVRDVIRATNDLGTSRRTLATLLHLDTTVETTTALFVISGEMTEVEEFRRAAVRDHPQIARYQALSDQSAAAVRAQQATFKPEAFAFAQYDLFKRQALLGDPDWVFGVGIKYALVSSSGRRDRLRAAHQQEQQVEASRRDFERQLDVGVTRSWDALDTARQQFLLLDSAIEHAEENLRLQDLSFREGEATSLDVIDARLALGRVHLERAQAAYQFAVTLGDLLDAAGQSDQFDDYIRRADRVIQP